MSIDWMSVAMLWGPLSLALEAVFLVVFGAAAYCAYRLRRQIVAWFLARVKETSSAHAFYLAIVSTGLWLADLAHLLPADDHVPIGVVRLAWGSAICLFVKRDKVSAEGLPAAKALLVAAMLGTMSLTLAACSTPTGAAPPPPSWSAGQKAYIDLVTYQAAQQIAATIARQPSLSARDVEIVKASEGAASSSLVAVVQAYVDGGSATAQAYSGVSAAAAAAASHLQGLLSAAHGTVGPDAVQLAEAAGISALANVPTVLLAIDKVDSGFVPSADDFAALEKSIQAEDAAIQAIGGRS